MQAPAEKNIIPIFSRRKRPRQALYAYPAQGTENAGGAPNSAPYSQQTFSNSNLYTCHERTDGWQGSTNSASCHPTGDGRPGGWQGAHKPINQRPTNTSNKPGATCNYAKASPYLSSNQPIPHPGPQQHAGNMKRPLRPLQQKYDEPSPVKTSRPSASPVPHSSNYQCAPRYHIQEPQGLRFPAAHSPTTHQQTMHPPKVQPSTIHQPSMHQPTMHHAAASSPRQPPDISHTSTSLQARGSMRNAPFRMPSTPQMPVRHSQPGSAAWEMRSPESAGCIVDKSMKMLTVSIEELRYWTVSRDIQGLLFFELFGTLSSAVCSNETGLAKKFTLKDGNHTLQCIFYETDRPLGPLTRGQHLRCVGNILPREGVFRCVSVRPATLAEQKVMRSMVAACDKGVRERLSATGIEP